MAFVQKQLTAIPFAQGLDTKTDPKQLPIGKLKTLKNAVFTKTGELTKRKGYDVLGTSIEGGGNLTSGVALATFGDELVLFDGGTIYSYSTATTKWQNRRAAVSCVVRNNQILRSSNTQQLVPDVAYVSGLELYVWEDSGVNYAIRDTTTGALLVPFVSLSASGIQPRATVLSGKFVVLWKETTNLKCVTIDPATPLSVSATATPKTDALSGGVFDAVEIVASSVHYLAVVYWAGTAGAVSLRVTRLTTALAVNSTAIVQTGITSTVAGCAIATDANYQLWMTYALVADAKVRGALYSLTLASITAPFDINASFTANIVGVCPTSINAATFVYDGSHGSPAQNWTRVESVSAVGVVTGVGTIRSVRLATVPWAYGSDVWVNVAFDSPLQASYFTIRLTENSFPIVAKAVSQEGGGARTRDMAAGVWATSTGVYLWANSRKGKINSESNVVFSLLGVDSTSIDFAHPNRFLDTTNAGRLLYVGGALQAYDGVSAIEHGFHVYPEGVTASAAGGGGSIDAGSHQWCVTYEWTDNMGRIERSAPSVPVTVVCAANDQVTLTIPTLRLTGKRDPRAKVRLVVYRTAAAGVLFHRATSVIAPLENDHNVDSLTFVDSASDANIAANELLYTTGNVMENIAPPACTLIASFQNRVAIAGLEDENQIWFSKNRFDNSNEATIPIEFTAENTISCDPRGGPITALGAMDDKLVIFKESSIYTVSGDGPNDTGGGQAFADPQLVATDTGCSSPASVVLTPQGLMFQSTKGIYLLDRSLNVSYLGAPVESYNASTVVGAALLADQNVVAFVLDTTGTILVYDYYHQQWGTWTLAANSGLTDAVVWQGAHTLLGATGGAAKLGTSYLDGGGADINLEIETADIALAQLAGFQRVFRVGLTGQWYSAHDLDVVVAYDYEASGTTAATMSLTQSTDTPLLVRVDFARQKCTAIRLHIIESQLADGQGLSLSGMTLEWGAMPGINRVPRTSTFGAA